MYVYSDLKVAQLENLTSDPALSPKGRFYLNTTSNVPKYYNGTSWIFFVDLSTAQTLTNKTLTTPIISQISNTGTLTLPTSTDTLVGRATTDTLTNKTLTNPTVTTGSFTSPGITGANLNFGTGTDSNRVVLPTVTTAQKNALANVDGLAVYDTDLNTICTNNGAAWSTLSTASIATSTAAGIITTFAPTVQSSFLAVSSANYTILDNDGYKAILVTTGASNRTITLPTAADNDGREIIMIKMDTGAGAVILDGEGAETINGVNSQTIFYQYESMVVRCDGANWQIVAGDYGPRSKSDVVATMLGQKQYLYNVAYNGGVTPTTTGSVVTTTIVRGVYIPYQMQDGTWRMRFEIVCSVTSGARTSQMFSVNGVTFKNTANWNQPASGWVVSGTDVAPFRTFCDDNTDDIYVQHASATTTDYGASGDVELESKPTWAF